jgi:phosphomannomutase
MDCYRTCDVRGRYPDEINEELFFHFGKSVAQQVPQGKAILIAGDLRPSSVPLKQAFAEGAVVAGAHVLDAGLAPTPILYFGKRMLGTYAGAMITASHNPPEYNGLKLLLGRYPAMAAQLRALKPGVSLGPTLGPRGKIEPVDLFEPYLEFLSKTWRDRLRARPAIKPISLVMDPGNGAWALLIREIIQQLEIEAKVIHLVPDGTFPNRSPDCMAPGSLGALAEEVKHQGASMGMAWDGDGDRVAICDDAGKTVSSDEILLMLLPDLLRGTVREKILYDLKMSNKIKSTIEALGALPIVERSAHCFLEARMINEGCLFGCECQGHMFFRELGGADDGMYAGLMMADFLQRNQMPLSELARQIPQLFITGDLRIPGGETEFYDIKRCVENALSFARFSYLDGLKVEMPGSWFLIRTSVSENKLTFRFEGDTASDLDAAIERVMRLLPEQKESLQHSLDLWRSGTSF